MLDAKWNSSILHHQSKTFKRKNTFATHFWRKDQIIADGKTMNNFVRHKQIDISEMLAVKLSPSTIISLLDVTSI